MITLHIKYGNMKVDHSHTKNIKITYTHTMTKEGTQDMSRETLYVTYCDGIGCNASTKGALNMTRLGFEVKELLGGIDWWKRDGYPTESDGDLKPLA